MKPTVPTHNFQRSAKSIQLKIHDYWLLIKSWQTGLLVLTGLTGYSSAQCPVLNWNTVFGLTGSLFLAVSGCTALNMVYDRDIDAQMSRTMRRPLPSGRIGTGEAILFGVILSVMGLCWAFALSFMYGIVITAGLFIDLVIYTIWLKRKTAWSIIWGGLSGGMPILAGRILGTGSIDIIGALLALSILLWIPTHILTFNMRYFYDYSSAGIPTFPSTYGNNKTRLIIALSSVGVTVSNALGFFILGLEWGYLRFLAVLSIGIIGLAVISIYRPSEKLNFGLFKYASLYMLGSMLMVFFGSQG
jgi:heme o synthase